MANMAQVKTIPVHSEVDEAAEPTHGIMVAVNTEADGMQVGFVRELAKTIALHRMCSPPDTSVLVVSVIGPFDGETFRADWSRALAETTVEMKALRFFLGQMSTAVLAHGKRDGTVLQSIPLKVE